jgi:hypothetical protein
MLFGAYFITSSVRRQCEHIGLVDMEDHATEQGAVALYMDGCGLAPTTDWPCAR